MNLACIGWCNYRAAQIGHQEVNIIFMWLFIYLLSVCTVFGELTEEMEITDGSYCPFATSLHCRVQEVWVQKVGSSGTCSWAAMFAL
jgi:hypothetical protein